MNNPWNRPELQTAKLLSIDENDMIAHIQIKNHRYYVLIDMSQTNINTLLDIGNYYGITAFLDQDWHMIDYSYVTPEMLTPVAKTTNGVDVYE